MPSDFVDRHQLRKVREPPEDQKSSRTQVESTMAREPDSFELCPRAMNRMKCSWQINSSLGNVDALAVLQLKGSNRRIYIHRCYIALMQFIKITQIFKK